MKNLILSLSICFGMVAVGFSQQATEVKKTTPVTTISQAEKTGINAAPVEKSEATPACCKGKSAKDCCKGKKGNAKACAHAKEGNAAAHNCAAHGSTKTADATGAKPACCAGKKDGAGCAHHGHGEAPKGEGTK